MLSLEQFTEGFETVRPVLLAHAQLAIGKRDAEDIVQDCYVKASELLPRFEERDGESGLRGWLLSIVNNLLRHYKRKSREVVESDLPSPVAYTQLLTEGQKKFADIYDAARRCLPVAGLTPEETVAVRMRLDGHTLHQIARVQGSSSSTVHDRLKKGVAKMQECPVAHLYRDEVSGYTARGHRITRYFAPTSLGSALAREHLAALGREDAKNERACKGRGRRKEKTP